MPSKPNVSTQPQGRAGLTRRLFNEGGIGPRALLRAAVIGAGFAVTRVFDFCGLLRWFYGRRIYYWIYAAGKSITDKSKIELIRRFIRPGDTCIDVGGAFGFFTRVAAKAVGTGGRVIVLEPNPVCASFIEDLTRTRKFSNVSLKRAAAWDETTTLTLNLCTENRGENSLFASPIHQESVTVPAIPIDTLCPPTEAVSFIKMDIQGAELKALRGMVRLLRGRDRVALLIECSPDDLKLAGSSEHELVPLLIDLGFTIHRLDRTPMTRVNSAMDLQDLASNAFSQCDLLASKADNRY